MDGVLMDGIMQMPIGWKLWVFWMMIVNTASIFFLKHNEGRYCLALWIPNGITMTLLAEQLGYVRLLGVSHIIWWTPLIIYLFLRRKQFDLKTLSGKWAVVLLVTNSVALAFDYVDLIRYVAGDREDQRPGTTSVEEELTAIEAGAYQALPFHTADLKKEGHIGRVTFERNRGEFF